MSKYFLSFLALLMVAWSAETAGSGFVFRPIGGYPNAFQTAPNDVNSSQWIVGFYLPVGGFDHGYIQKGKAYKTIEPPQVLSSYLSGINDTGTMVGGYCDTSCNPRNAQHGYLYEKGKYKKFDYPAAGTSIVPEGINNLGEIVGGYCPGLFSCPEGFLPSSHAFLLSRGLYTTLDFPSAKATQAYAINDAGSIVGSYLDSAIYQHAYLYQGGVFTNIDFPGSQGTAAVGINNAGTVSGYYADAKAIVHGFIYRNGAFKRVDVAGAFSTSLGGISNTGDVTAAATVNNAEVLYLGIPSH
jgi:probable HAF family extracellular repeat protein